MNNSLIPQWSPIYMVDTHFHIFFAHEALTNTRYIPTYDALLEDWKNEATRCGVTRGVLVQPSFLGTNNQRLLDALDENLLRGVVVVDSEAPPSLSELRRWDERGVRGIRLNLAGTDHKLNEISTLFWDCFNALPWHLELHHDQGKLPEVLLQIPQGIPLVIDHFGKPSPYNLNATFEAVAKRTSNTYVKLSAKYRLDPSLKNLTAKLAEHWLDVLGQDRLLWGSDWPCTNHEDQAHYSDLMSEITSMNIAAKTFTDNAMNLYWN